MENLEFIELCNRYAIAPNIALENNNIVELLLNMRNTNDDNAKRGYRNALITTLEQEF